MQTRYNFYEPDMNLRSGDATALSGASTDPDAASSLHAKQLHVHQLEKT